MTNEPSVRRLGNDAAPLDARSLGLPRKRPVIALAATTTPLPDNLAPKLAAVLRELMPVLAERRAVIVTGGTDVGVIAMVGRAVSAASPAPALIGIAPAGLVGADGHALEPHHGLVLLAPGDNWGDETATLSRAVSAIGAGRPEIALLVGGGDGARLELVEHLSKKRPVLVLAGSGRLADDIAQRRFGADAALAAMVARGDVRIINLDEGPQRLAEEARTLLTPRRRTMRELIPPLMTWPRIRVRDTDGAAVLGPDVARAYPLLSDAIAEADLLIGPAFREADVQAMRAQNRHRLFTLLALIGGMVTTVFGAMQSWLQSAAWPGVAVAVLGALTSALATMARAGGALDAYLQSRIRAERLRSLYFEHIAATPPTTDEERHERLRVLTRAVTERQYGPAS